MDVGVDDPMVRHQLDPALVVRSWSDGAAVVVEHGVTWPDAPAGATALLCLGPTRSLARLAREVVREVPGPWRVAAEADAVDVLPAAWQPPDRTRAWHWMLTDRPSRAAVPDVAVVAVSPHEVRTVLASVNPGSGIRGRLDDGAWLGVRLAGRLAAVGAVERRHDGTGHLSGIGTLRAVRGRGLGGALTAALLRSGLDGGSGIVTLGVHATNEGAVRLYRRHGFEVVHTLVSGHPG